MSYLVDRHTQILSRTAAVIPHDGRKRATVAEPRAEFVVLASADTKKRLPVSWEKIHRLVHERPDTHRSDNDIHQEGHLIFRTASCIYEAGRPRPPRPYDLVIGLAGKSSQKRQVSWEQIYLLARRLDGENTRFEAAALKAQINHEPHHLSRLRRRK